MIHFKKIKIKFNLYYKNKLILIYINMNKIYIKLKKFF